MYIRISQDELNHYGVKGMRWGVRKAISEKRRQRISKYANKAQRQADYFRRHAKTMKGKYGDHDDEELFDSLSPSEKRQERKRFERVGKYYIEQSKYWDKAVKDISNSTSGKEAKAKYKKYKSKGYYTYIPKNWSDGE